MPADSSHRSDDSAAAQQWSLSLVRRSEREVFRYVAARAPSAADAETHPMTRNGFVLLPVMIGLLASTARAARRHAARPAGEDRV
jgi:hypothetical protein